jgi:2-polyprenyl-6-methoxyphenol hydroxylase-like FAD-dependent oxidoreductase
MQLTLLRRWYQGWHEPIEDLLAATDAEDLVQETVSELRPLPESFTFPVGGGGYALLGDAAHALADPLGQGAGLALEDAATLRALVAEAEPGPALAGALQAYSRARRPRVGRLSRQARRLGTVLQASGRFGARARGAALGTIAPRLLESAAGAASDWQPPGSR